MASPHWLCHHPTTASYCHCYSSCHHHPPPPPPPDCHPVYHAPPQPHRYSAQTHLPNTHRYHPHFQEPYFQDEIESQHTVSSLLRRIAALEAALRRRASPSSSSSSSPFHSLRNAAARTIQTHFRAFLLRRSRTLRQLKDLASIKSRLGLLKTSISEKTHFDFDILHHEAVTLLLKVDAVQGGDPMIRDGKRSVMRGLNDFLDFLDGFCVERRVNARFGRNNVKKGVGNNERKPETKKYGGPRTGNMDKLRGLAERIDKLAEELDGEEGELTENRRVFVKKNDVSGLKSRGLLKNLSGVQPKVKKNVTFADNGKVYRVLRRNIEPYIDGNDDDLGDDLCGEVEVIRVAEDDDGDEVEAHSEKSKEDDDVDSLHSSDGEKELRKMPEKGEADDFTFDAPLPLKMETRAT